MTEVEAGELSAGRNGYEFEQVEIEEVDEGWMATIDDTIDAPFGSAIGRGELTARASAVAHCSLGGNLPGLFAGGDNCPDGGRDDDNAIMWDSDDVTVFGDVHTNGFIWIDGDGNAIIDGDLTYVVDYDIESGNPDIPDPIQVGAQDFPLIYPEGHFDPGHSNFAFDENDDDFTYYTGSHNFNTTPDEGIHVVEDRIEIDVDGMTGHFTFVSLTDRIKVHGDDHDLTAYHDDLLFYAPRPGGSTSCSEPSDIRLEDDTATYTGNALAPRGRIWVDGDDEWVLNGSLIGWAITLQGDELTMTIDTEAAGEGDVSIVR